MIVILGAGVTGLSIAYHLRERGEDFILIEKEEGKGGLCRSINSKDYIFDYAGHFLHARSPYVRQLAKKLLPEILSVKRKSFIFLNGRMIPYPIQANLNYLPIFDRLKSIAGYLLRERKEPKNLHDWILANFGKGMANLFFFPYNRKLWRYPLTWITPDFLSPFVPGLSLFQTKEELGYNVEFLYPRKGIGEFTSALGNGIEIFHGEVKQIHEGYVLFEKGSIEYDQLISTIPLPLFWKMLDLGSKVRLKSGCLKWNSVFCLNIGIRGNLSFPGIKSSSMSRESPEGFHWIYFPEERYPFYRVGSFSNVSPLMAPEGHSSLWVEVSYRERRPGKEMIDRIITALSMLNFFKKDSVEHILPLDIQYAYPIYNKGRKEFLSTIEECLENYNISLAGRFGKWKYSYMEESILDGREIAREICKQ